MYLQSVHREFRNVGFSSRNRTFPGFPAKSAALRHILAPRQARYFDLKADDIISVRPLGDEQSVCLHVVDDRGNVQPALLGLEQNATIHGHDFEHEPLKGWVLANGGSWSGSLDVVRVPLDDLMAFKAGGVCTVWLLRPVEPGLHVSAASQGLVELSMKPSAAGNAQLLPPSLGEVREEFTIGKGSARAYEVQPGEIIQIIDVEGQQCSDFVALRKDALDTGTETMVDSTATRSMVRSAYPAPGIFDKFYDSAQRPMLAVLQDTCGRHDTFGMACTALGYADRGFPGHLNCSDNISHALDPYGVGYRPAWPAINFFWSTWIDTGSQHLLTEESHSRPGDYVAMKALDRMVCVSTACPDDIDPINGWNPTDVHVRIYRKDAPIRRAVAYREKEDAPMSITSESPFHAATAKLTDQFAPARDLWAPISFPSVGTVGEYWACREKVTLQDMSSLRKYDIVGPDAERLLQLAVTRDVSRLAVWRGMYTLICDDAGSVIDDGTLFRLSHDLFRWCCGSEESARALKQIADAEGLQVRIHGMGGSLPNLALQGPRSRDVLKKLVLTKATVPSLDMLKWFGVTVARAGDREGVPFMLSRSGYTGELGYELFCAGSDAPALWDAIMEAGEEFGITPMGSAALEIIRIEAGLAAANAEFAPGVDAFEAGLGFAVDLRKEAFQGRTALERNAREPRRVLRGLKFSGNDVPAHGARVYSGERPVGVITSATRSPTFGCAIAMARLAVEHADTGSNLEAGQMDGRMKRLPAIVTEIPFVDPQRKRARA